jgi:hypothetical protein
MLLILNNQFRAIAASLLGVLGSAAAARATASTQPVARRHVARSTGQDRWVLLQHGVLITTSLK